MNRLALLAAFLLGSCQYQLPALDQSSANRTLSTSEWRSVTAETGSISDVPGLEQLARDFPESGSVRLRLLRAQFAADDTAGVVRSAVWLAERGYAFNEGARAQIVGLAGETAIADKLAVLFARNASAKSASKAVATVPASARLVEDLAINPDTGGMIVSAVVSRSLHFQMPGGEWNRLPVAKAGNLSGIALSAENRSVIVASGNLGMVPDGETMFSGLVEIRQSAPLAPEYFPAPDGVNLSDIVRAADGTVFASDPVGGGIYRKTSGAIGTLIAPGTLRSPQGFAISPDNKRLYVSDYRYGIAVIEPATGSVARLAATKPLLLDGIDGLWLDGNRLIGMQNGSNPKRIVAISLSSDGKFATGMEVLEQAHPDWTEPLGGTVYNGALYYVATGQWDRFEEGGAVKEGAELAPTQLRKLPLR